MWVVMRKFLVYYWSFICSIWRYLKCLQSSLNPNLLFNMYLSIYTYLYSHTYICIDITKCSKYDTSMTNGSIYFIKMHAEVIWGSDLVIISSLTSIQTWMHYVIVTLTRSIYSLYHMQAYNDIYLNIVIEHTRIIYFLHLIVELTRHCLAPTY